MNELINFEAVCRTAPARPGLSNISWPKKLKSKNSGHLLMSFFQYMKNKHILIGHIKLPHRDECILRKQIISFNNRDN